MPGKVYAVGTNEVGCEEVGQKEVGQKEIGQKSGTNWGRSKSWQVKWSKTMCCLNEMWSNKILSNTMWFNKMLLNKIGWNKIGSNKIWLNKIWLNKIGSNTIWSNKMQSEKCGQTKCNRTKWNRTKCGQIKCNRTKCGRTKGADPSLEPHLESPRGQGCQIEFGSQLSRNDVAGSGDELRMSRLHAHRKRKSGRYWLRGHGAVLDAACGKKVNNWGLGSMLRFKKIFSTNNWWKKIGDWTQNTLTLCQKWITTISLIAIFSAKNYD
jgi:hypothetical protein